MPNCPEHAVVVSSRVAFLVHISVATQTHMLSINRSSSRQNFSYSGLPQFGSSFAPANAIKIRPLLLCVHLY